MKFDKILISVLKFLPDSIVEHFQLNDGKQKPLQGRTTEQQHLTPVSYTSRFQ